MGLPCPTVGETQWLCPSESWRDAESNWDDSRAIMKSQFTSCGGGKETHGGCWGIQSPAVGGTTLAIPTPGQRDKGEVAQVWKGPNKSPARMEGTEMGPSRRSWNHAGTQARKEQDPINKEGQVWKKKWMTRILKYCHQKSKLYRRVKK